MQLVLGDYIKRNPDSSQHIAQATDVINWFNNHSLALHILFAEQCTLPEFSKCVLALIRAAITRWGTHVTSIDRLLRVSTPMRSAALKRGEDLQKAAGIKADAISKAKQILAIINDANFWSDLKE